MLHNIICEKLHRLLQRCNREHCEHLAGFGMEISVAIFEWRLPRSSNFYLIELKSRESRVE